MRCICGSRLHETSDLVCSEGIVRSREAAYHIAGQDGTEYDYENQAWVQDGKYVSCAHPAEMGCRCYGRLHAGEPYQPD